LFNNIIKSWNLNSNTYVLIHINICNVVHVLTICNRGDITHNNNWPSNVVPDYQESSSLTQSMFLI